MKQITLTQGDSVRLWDLEIEAPDDAIARFVVSTAPGDRALISGDIDMAQSPIAARLDTTQTAQLLPGRYVVGIVVESTTNGSRKETQGTILVKPSVAYGFSSTPPSGTIKDITIEVVDAVRGVF